MSDINTGGPAFPSGLKEEADDTVDSLHKGMTLRDYFAIRIFQSRVPINTAWTVQEIADQAYKDADAMLKARI